MPDPAQPLPEHPAVDTTVPSIARVYDAFVGGKDNFEVDREVFHRVLEVAPEAAETGRQCRQWLIRVVRFLAGEAGVDQFLDCGSGLPTAENTHQVAQLTNPEAEVVYVDNDPAVAAYGRALLEENERTHFAVADLRRPEELFRHPTVAGSLDLDRPLALMHCNTLHHVTDAERPAEIMAEYVDALAPGSYVAISHVFKPDPGEQRHELALDIEARFHALMGSCYYRTRAEITELFTGLELVDPGIGYLFDWWPDGPRATQPSDVDHLLLGGVARKP